MHQDEEKPTSMIIWSKETVGRTLERHQEAVIRQNEMRQINLLGAKVYNYSNMELNERFDG